MESAQPCFLEIIPVLMKRSQLFFAGVRAASGAGVLLTNPTTGVWLNWRCLLTLWFTEGTELVTHMGAEPENSFKGGPRGPLYGILTTWYHRLRDYVSPNQSCKVFGDFGQKSWLTLRHVCGHVTRATWLLRVPWAGPWAVDNFRHWNFSICSKNIGDMAILVMGYNHKKCWKLNFFEKTTFLRILQLYPISWH